MSDHDQPPQDVHPRTWEDHLRCAEHYAKTHKDPKVRKVMHEYKEGTLKSSSGHKVTSRAQAVAIALHEAGLSRDQ